MAAAARGTNWRLVLVGLAVLAFAFLGNGHATADSPTTTTTFAITANGVPVTAVPEGTQLTFTATVTGVGAAPTGGVVFVRQDNGLALGDAAALTPTGPTTSSAVFQATLLPSATPYSIRAEYNPDLAALGAGLTPSVSAYESVTVSQVTLSPTHVTLTSSPAAPTAGGTMTFTATVTTEGSTTPTGTVDFSSTVGGFTTRIGSADLVNGVATLSVDGWAAGDYTIEASYGGDASNLGSGASIDVTVAPGGSFAVKTDTTVSVSPTTIHADELVTITAHVVQEGTHTPPPGGGPDDVEFRGNGTTLGTAGLDANGNATLVVGGWADRNETYDIKASYVGNIFQNIAPSSGHAMLVVEEVPHPTALSYDGDTHGPTGSPIHLSATLVDLATGGALANEPVVLSLGGVSCTATTNAAGRASCNVTTFDSAGSERVTATFAGDGPEEPSSASAPFTITAPATPLSTQLTYAGDAAALAGAPATLAFTLASNGTPLPGRTVTLVFLGTPHTLTTDAGGVARLAANAPAAPGPYPVSASFAGDASYSTATGSGKLVVLSPTLLTYSGASSAPGGGTTTIAFTLTEASSGQPLAGRTVTLTFNGTAYTAVTGADGRASVAVTAPLSAQSYSVTGSFAGDSTYAPTDGSGTLTVTTIPTTLAYTGDTTVTSGAVATLSARLTDASGRQLTGETVAFQLASGEQCTGVTQGGTASCTVRVNAPAGPDAVQIHFAGDPPELPSDATATLTVTLADSKLVLTPVAPVLSGSAAGLGATLTSVQTGLPLSGKTVTLTLGAQSCTATTTPAGVASCSIASVTAPVGNAPVTAAFAGDRFAKPSSASGTALVYALAPGGGTFVVGDRSAAGKVTFWGAQWAKLNSLTGGSAPDAFKGFAPAPARCGASWTTHPGNSTPPPSGPLPAYMAVVVSSSISKSGSAISGDAKRIVVVKTDPGYASDPGHAGTGTVVATVCG